MLFLPDSRSLICDKRKRDNHTKPFFKTIQKGEKRRVGKKIPTLQFYVDTYKPGQKLKC
jgi:hypothetical protein